MKLSSHISKDDKESADQLMLRNRIKHADVEYSGHEQRVIENQRDTVHRGRRRAALFRTYVIM